MSSCYTYFMQVKAWINSYARYAGLATVCIEWLAIGLFYTLRPDGFSGQSPISYFAAYPETQLVFSVCLTIAAVSFWVFSTWHLPKHYNTPVRLFAVSMLGYAALALTPFDPYNAASDALHKVLALGFSVTYLAGIYLVGKHNHDQQVRRASYLTVAVGGIAMVIFLLMDQNNPYRLLFEATSAMIGQMWIVWISWHSFKKIPTD